MVSDEKYKLIDLFSGCGGMTRGFIDTGRFESVFANDFNSFAVESYKANFDKKGAHTVLGDIVDLIDNHSHTIPSADIVIGGPPCQGFSLLNKNRQGDPRRSLWFQFMRVVELSGARVVVMENVRQLLTSPECEAILATLKKLGFKYLQKRVLNAADYGVPEMRFRTIIMASKDNHISLPVPSHCDPAKLLDLESNLLHTPLPQPWNTVKSAIGNLSEPIGTEIRNLPSPQNLHFGRQPRPESVERYLAVPPGGNRFDLQRNRPDITPACWINKPTGSTDLFGRLWWNRPSVTIRTEFFKPEKGRYLHPDQNRPITHREAARIQSFPDDFIFKGPKIEIAKQIGNAVPPLLAKAIGFEAIRSLDGQTDSRYVNETETIYQQLAAVKIAV
ncbi:MAG: DNA cytosine methyltransferase [Desulfuromonadales bacterium]|nr:DNA cytosine methyltransferase [Desulfuromonadales bacterium]